MCGGGERIGGLDVLISLPHSSFSAGVCDVMCAWALWPYSYTRSRAAGTLAGDTTAGSTSTSSGQGQGQGQGSGGSAGGSVLEWWLSRDGDAVLEEFVPPSELWAFRVLRLLLQLLPAPWTCLALPLTLLLAPAPALPPFSVSSLSAVSSAALTLLPKLLLPGLWLQLLPPLTVLGEARERDRVPVLCCVVLCQLGSAIPASSPYLPTSVMYWLALAPPTGLLYMSVEARRCAWLTSSRRTQQQCNHILCEYSRAIHPLPPFLFSLALLVADTSSVHHLCAAL